MNRSLYATAFGAGLLAIGWVGFGYVQTQPLALTITALIGAFYLMGALELQRFHQATAALHRALHGLAGAAGPTWATGSSRCRPSLRTPCGCASKASGSRCPARR